MSVLKKIYNKAPIFFQNIMTSFAGRRKNKIDMESIILNTENFLKNLIG